MSRVLILAGTTEATELARQLVDAGHDVTSSLAGLTSTPVDRPGRVRRGGFGGPAGLADYLRSERIDAMVDATHPFAAVMPFNAAQAAELAGVARCRLVRPPWVAVDGDRWTLVPSLDAAAAVIAGGGPARVFLAIGMRSVAAFGPIEGVSYLVRSIEPSEAVPAGAQVVLARGPFDLADELSLLQEHSIDTLVAKNAGGTATSAKLGAARRLGLPVVMVERPPQPTGTSVATPAEATRWVSGGRSTNLAGHETQAGGSA